MYKQLRFDFVASGVSIARVPGDVLIQAQTEDIETYVFMAKYNLRKARWIDLRSDDPDPELRKGSIEALTFDKDTLYDVLCLGSVGVNTFLAVPHPAAEGSKP